MHVRAGQVQNDGQLLQGERVVARVGVSFAQQLSLQYYTGEVVAPIPTIFVGGNHEASNYLWEASFFLPLLCSPLEPHAPQLYFGGWVCPNIYYLGASGCVRFGDLRVAGLSGIFKAGDFTRPYSRPPYTTPGELKGAYHVRELDVAKLSCLSGRIDAFVSHDWPTGVAAHGDAPALCRSKPFLKDELVDGSLGSPPNAALLARLAPDYWFRHVLLLLLLFPSF